MPSNTTTFAPILSPEQVGRLVLEPLTTESVAGQVLTPVRISSHSYRVPAMTATPSASWVNEGEEIDVSDATMTEIGCTPPKLAAITVISSELANDSSPSATDAVGQAILRDITRRFDEALFSTVTAPAPAGLAALSGVTAVTAGATLGSLDAFSDAQYAVEQVGGKITSWVTNPSTAQALSKLKQLTGSNVPLLGVDPTAAGARTIMGVPLLTSPYVTATKSVVWGISRQFAQFVIRQDASVEADRSVYWTSDRVGVRAILRAGFVFSSPSTIAKISTT
jgi:HK97 family phage major capsid protein